MIITESWGKFTAQEHQTWETLFQRQSVLLQNRAAQEVIDGLKTLEICDHQIPRFSKLNEILMDTTGFSIVPVSGLIPEDMFFDFLAKRQFPSTCFIRKPEQLDYLEEPDIFHDVFGHVPLLANPVFADFMQMFGKKGLQAIEHGVLHMAGAIYWFTVEFGLIQTTEGMRIYGAGITSSIGETRYSLESDIPKRLPFELHAAMSTAFRTDVFQERYFFIKSFEELFGAVEQLDWKAIKNGAELCQIQKAA